MASSSGIPISATDVQRDESSYVDPNGYLFRYNGDLYRAIRKSAAPFYRRLIDDGAIEALISDRHLVSTLVTNLELDDPDVGFIVRHETIQPATYCVEWCPAMLRDAALTVVDFLSALLRHDAILQDAYPWNIVFRGTDPVFVDLTSIVEIDTPYLWPAYDQYQAFFLRPLILTEQGSGTLARALMLNNIAGITLQDFFHHVSLAHKVRHPVFCLGCLVDRRIQRSPGLKRRLRAFSIRAQRSVDNTIREQFYRGLKRRLESFRFVASEDVWTAYYRTIGPEVDREAKLGTVGALLERLRPETVLDLGCNTGAFSVMAAERGARVISIDSSEACTNRLYSQAKANRLTVTPLISDVICPTPAFGFMGMQYPSLIRRARSDTVLCLGLMHHLHVAGRQSFDRIARLMDALAERHLIFEFVAMDDTNIDLIGAGREISYDLQSVLTELRPFFPEIQVLESDRRTRSILLCSRK